MSLGRLKKVIKLDNITISPKQNGSFYLAN